MKLAHGVIHEVSYPEGFWLETPDGTMAELNRATIEHLEQQGTPVPIEVPVEVQLDGNQVQGWSRDETVMQAPIPPNVQDVALVYVDQNALPEKLPAKEARALEHNVRRVTNGKVDVKYTPYVVSGMEIMTVTSGPWNDLIADVARQNPENTHNAYHALSQKIIGFCGNAFISGSRACSNPSNCPPTTQNHECPGHRGAISPLRKGLHHSGGDPSGEYGDKAGSYMGAGSGRSNWLACQLYYAGVIDDDEVHHLSDGVLRAFLVDPEIVPVAMRPGERKAVFATGDTGREICVSYHQTAGGGRVYVHRREPATAHNWHKTWWLATMRPGDTFTAEGVHVHCLVTEENSAEVVVKTAEALPDPDPESFPEWVRPDDAFPVRDSWGVWRNKQWSHQGIPVHVIANRVAATWYTWNRDEDPIWFLMQGDIDPSGDWVELTIYATNGQRNMWVDGRAILYFYDQAHGMCKMNSRIMGRTAMPLDRLTTFGLENPLNGLYSTGDNEGFSIFASHPPEREEELLFLWHYGYKQGTGFGAPARQNWNHADGPVDGQNLIAYQPRHGHPEVKSRHSELDPIGEARITRHDANHLTIRMDGKDHEVHRLA